MTAPSCSFVLSGPNDGRDRANLPVRGDLAHIDLAGVVFVAHYAVPMPHRATGAAIIYATNSETAQNVGELAEGDVFDVLDIAGKWAWGCVGKDGPVGYVLYDLLEAAA